MMSRNTTTTMTTPLGSLHDHYVQLADPRTSGWPFMGSPVPIVTLIGIYLLFATRIGPWLMRDCQPFKIRNLLFAYNATMVGLSVYFMYITITYMGMRDGQSLLCWPTDPEAHWNKHVLSRQGLVLHAHEGRSSNSLRSRSTPSYQVVVNCGISRILAFVGALEGILFATLFTDFYYTAYVKKRSKTY
ncbi:hypothetical protein MRX96_001638 [Rhipicephalus microplus]